MASQAYLTGRNSDALPGFCRVTDAVRAMASAGVEVRGAIFTRREVVDFILDLTGYTADKPLHTLRLLEPSFGEGDFLLPAVARLLDAWGISKKTPADLATLRNAVRAVEVHESTYSSTRLKLLKMLAGVGLHTNEADQLADAWLIQNDFLLARLDGAFDFVIGNPPYVRQELIPDILMAEYRARYRTIYDRADIYIPFIERSVGLLAKGGHLGFICADRWMKNRYGGPLRQMIAANFRLKVFVDMVDTPAFHSDVIAYPGIIVISREKAGPTRIAHRPAIEGRGLADLAKALTAQSLGKHDGVKELNGLVAGAEPWLLESSDQLALVRRLESAFPVIEDAGCKVGIGVATGADQAFIGMFDELDVEEDRKLPLAMTRDILSGELAWRGFGVVNPFTNEGPLVNLTQYPRLKKYLESRKDDIAKRHVAMKAPANWYRTIDRITPSLTYKPKLLIPDIKGEANIVLDQGTLYPHHNLYFITSDEWDIRALQAVLLSGIAKLFVAVYSTKMRGGYLRFQAQYLRRIRIPKWTDVPHAVQTQLVQAAINKDKSACDRAVFALYKLTPGERAALGGNGD